MATVVSSNCGALSQTGSSSASPGSAPDWSPVALTTCPPARSQANLVSFPVAGGGTDALLVGGADNSNLAQGDEWLWNGTGWRELPNNGPRPPAVSSSAMTYDSTHSQVVFYGGDITGVAAYDVWTLDPASLAWTKHAEPAGAGAAGTWPQTNLEVGLSDDPTDRGVLFVGQFVGPSVQTWLWNGTGWTKESPAHEPTTDVESLSLDPSTNTPLLFGSTTWRWQGGDWNLLNPAHSPPAVSLQRATTTIGAPGGILLFSPTDASTWEWTGTDWTKLTTLASPEQRTDAAMAGFQASATSPFEVLLFGGLTGSARNLADDSWVFSPGTAGGGSAGSWTQKTLATNPGQAVGGLAGGSSAYDSADHQVVVFGGYSSTGAATGDTWTWDGTAWTDHAAGAGTPPARGGAAMATDPSGHVVMFGGLDASGSLLDDTWTWDGTSWTQDNPATHPGARTDGAMALLPGSGTDVLFGGAADTSGTSYLDETWTWDGTTWSQVAKAGSWPIARGDEGLAYDSITSKLLMYGGTYYDSTSGSAFTLQDTWTYAAGTWTAQTTGVATPDPLQNMAMVSDPADGGGVLLFGGLDSTTVEGGTWHWDGTGWSQPASTTAGGATLPPARFNGLAADDAADGEVVLSDGISSTFANLADTWTWHS